ncbi:MAG: hypothetical protein ACPLPT_01480 [Moorellales bacterium]
MLAYVKKSCYLSSAVGCRRGCPTVAEVYNRQAAVEAVRLAADAVDTIAGFLGL